MPLPSTVRKQVRTFLLPSEEIVYIFPATLPTSIPANFLVVVTDTSILVLSTGLLSYTTPKSVWGRYPRNTLMGPVDTKLTPTFTLGDIPFEVDEEYVPVINAADAEISSPDFLPPDPFPDL